MAKVTFTKLGLKKKDDIKTIKINDTDIEVKQYLPIEDKIQLVTNVMEYSADENNFMNPLKVEVFFNLEMLYAYTNLNFTDKQKEDAPKLYNLFEENGVFGAVIATIPQNEYQNLLNWTEETIAEFYKYTNSVNGILERVSKNYAEMNFDAQQIQDKIADPENLALLKQVVEKLG